MRRLLVLLIICLVVCCIPIVYTQNTEYISETALSQRALFKYLERCRDQDANRVLTFPNYTISGADLTSSQMTYLVDGVAVTVLATTTMQFSAPTQATTTKQLYLFCYNDSGVATCVPGVPVEAATLTPITFSTDPVLPDTPDGYIPVAYLEALVATAAFTLGTSNLSHTSTYTISITEFSILNHTDSSNYKDL